jgi:hypothetical protein
MILILRTMRGYKSQRWTLKKSHHHYILTLITHFRERCVLVV